ncbi:transfer RNA specific adenosine deaminase,tRNA-specific adenosine deaminase,tRNA-specific adenosine deaminase,Pyrimidine deaminase,riboflavin biosynthesis protein RibD,Cytidine and deoxycytidylate deaminase zinc-binding region [[Clostridium] sordellii]|uniref:nucleoside deaminase n=1 Tax=Paraclostridium sordellii TaxID=1505 RepID=UPI00054439A6|nr:nucleoside deaminase [Paeniclostridium sordellii]CEK35485.1 transfer RNA specific adenosine deaminase,tRNA-specific adenosine deaminase,tRNA-specific adenosine deaminase,Pyrimidine deaminase,riboflavin biosynthesis protein RibD,Cytidine and deoxycytidylate deaminase zinc-binding region [[Clostridium] sordellii] [Paeniclostridium sordellii]
MDKSFYMNEAIKEAYKAYEKGETPIGAVIVKDGKIISRAHNLTEILSDATAHAEILAIRKASDYLGGWRLINCDLYVTMEPCIMCSGAIVQSRIKKLIIGTKHIKNLNIEKQHKFKIDYFDTCNIEVTFDVLQEECSSILQKFFKELRNR